MRRLEHWTFHDLRVHSGNRIGETTLSIAVTEAALNHISGSKGGIVGIYQKHEYTDDKWAGHVEKLISNRATANVARFRRQRLRTKNEAIC